MRIGYIILGQDRTKEERLYSEGGCEQVVALLREDVGPSSFNNFLLTNSKAEIVIVDFESIGLQLNQLEPIMNILESEQIGITVMETGGLTSPEYLSLVFDLMLQEKQVRRCQTKAGIEAARKLGNIIGRPRISDESIVQIQELHKSKWTLREISEVVKVSLGTVHKYTQSVSKE